MSENPQIEQVISARLGRIVCAVLVAVATWAAGWLAKKCGANLWDYVSVTELTAAGGFVGSLIGGWAANRADTAIAWVKGKMT